MNEGNPSAAANAGSAGRELFEQAQRVRDNVAQFSGTARQTFVSWQDTLRAQLVRQPYVVLGAAACLGYVLGGGLPPLVVRAALGAAGRIALENALIAMTGHREAGAERPHA
jgi:hypothetical protein